MSIVVAQPSIKVIGANGQISLGKQYAGRQVLVEEQEAGVWLIRTATVIPDNERWLQQPKTAADLQQALTWAQEHPANDANVETVLEKLDAGEWGGSIRSGAGAPGLKQPRISRKPVYAAKDWTPCRFGYLKQIAANDLTAGLSW